MNLKNVNLKEEYRSDVDDIVAGIFSLIMKPSINKIPYNCFNIGSGQPKKLKKFVALVEKYLGKKTKIKHLPLQKGDVVKTHADIKALDVYCSYKPKTDIKIGIKLFIDWYKKYYIIK